MKRLISFLLILCLLASFGLAFAVELKLDDKPELDERIADLLEKYDAKDMLDDIKALLEESSGLSDEQLGERISALADSHGITLSDEQIDQIITVCRTLEKGQTLKESVEQGKEKVGGFFQSIRIFAQKAANFFQRISDLFGKSEKI